MIPTKILLSLASLLFSSCLLAASPNEPAPNCIVEHLTQKQILTISDYKNKVIYLDFWASWCPPCKLSFPQLDQLQLSLNNQDFAVIAINLDENKDDAINFLQHNPVSFIVAYDGEGTCPSGYNVMAMPSSYIIDKKGFIREVHLGFDENSLAKIRPTILALLAE